MNDSPPRLLFTVTVHDDRCHMTLDGEFDPATCDDFTRLVSAAHATGIRRFDLGVAGLTFAGACFANKVMELEQMAGSTVRLVDPPTPVARVLELTGLGSHVVLTMPGFGDQGHRPPPAPASVFA
ncbi:MAG: hypothetical protein JWM47_1975 [Acidimicrobiales bacterium]|nr:hypothetical protein [Acidimicrobiales bacterium]